MLLPPECSRGGREAVPILTVLCSHAFDASVREGAEALLRTIKSLYDADSASRIIFRLKPEAEMLKGDSQVLRRLADMIRALQFAKKILLSDVRLLGITVIVLLFFASVDRVPDKPSIFKEGGLRSTQSLHAPAGLNEPDMAATVCSLNGYHFQANSRLSGTLPPEIVHSFDSITGRSLAADLSPPHS